MEGRDRATLAGMIVTRQAPIKMSLSDRPDRAAQGAAQLGGL